MWLSCMAAMTQRTQHQGRGVGLMLMGKRHHDMVQRSITACEHLYVALDAHRKVRNEWMRNIAAALSSIAVPQQ